MDLMDWLFDVQSFPPRGTCGVGWSNWLIAEWLLGQGLIVGAYIAIPVGLVLLNIRRRDPFLASPMTILFAAFILFCGFGHLLSDMVVFVWPAYRLFAQWHLATGIVSVATAVVFSRGLRTLLDRPTNEEITHFASSFAALKADYETLAQTYIQDKKAVNIVADQFASLTKEIRVLKREILDAHPG